MRILFLSTWFPYPPDNGSKLRAYYLLRALAMSHQVTLVSFLPTETPARAYDAITDLASVVSVAADPFRFVRLPQAIKFASPVPTVFWPSRVMQQTVYRIGAAETWDAVVALQTPVARYAMQLRNVKRILDADTSLSYQARERLAGAQTTAARFRSWLSFWKVRRYERNLLCRFQTCTVVTQAEVGWLQALAGANTLVTVLSNGVDCVHNRPGLATKQRNSLIYSGSLTYSANHDAMRWFLVETYPRIRQAIPDVTLTITGSNQGVDRSGLALDDTVTLTGYVDDIRGPIAAATVCVVPVRRGGGTRLKILEAMALGTPVVATSKGAEGLDVADGQHLLLADSPDCFAQRTIALLRDAELRAHLTANARRLVEGKYDWQQIGAHFVHLVEGTVAESRGHRTEK